MLAFARRCGHCAGRDRVRNVNVGGGSQIAHRAVGDHIIRAASRAETDAVCNFEPHAALADPSHLPRRYAYDESMVGNVVRHNRSGADKRVTAHRHAADDGRICAERCAALD